jgi:hypothetical protein
MSTKIQLMVLPDTSGNRKEPRKFYSHTRANLSISASPAAGCMLSKHSMSHNDVTPEVFLKFTKHNERLWISKGMQLLNRVQIFTFAF